MKLLWHLFLSLALFAVLGCASKQPPAQRVPSAAFVSTQGALLNVTKARAALTKIQDPEAKRVEEALDAAEENLDNVTKQLITLEDQNKALAQAKEEAQIRELKAENAKRFWRAWTLRLTAITTLLALWIFRKPLLLLCGVPVL